MSHKWCFAVGASAVVAAYLAGLHCRSELETEVAVHTEITRDTVVVVRPEPVNVSPLPRYLPVRLPVVDNNGADSADVILPVSRYQYSDSLCMVSVSGYAVSFDTIRINVPHTLSTITVGRPVPDSRPLPHWGLGVGVGLALTSRGVQPAITLSAVYLFRLP